MHYYIFVLQFLDERIYYKSMYFVPNLLCVDAQDYAAVSKSISISKPFFA